MSKNMIIANHEAFGNLVKTWATGKSYFDDGVVYPAPKDGELDKLKDMLQAVGAGAWLDNIKHLRVIRYDENELVIKIPPKSFIEASEAEMLKPGGTYELPPFYGHIEAPGAQPNATEKQKLQLHAQRISDYTIAHCA